MASIFVTISIVAVYMSFLLTKTAAQSTNCSLDLFSGPQTNPIIQPGVYQLNNGIIQAYLQAARNTTQKVTDYTCSEYICAMVFHGASRGNVDACGNLDVGKKKESLKMYILGDSRALPYADVLAQNCLNEARQNSYADYDAKLYDCSSTNYHYAKCLIYQTQILQEIFSVSPTPGMCPCPTGTSSTTPMAPPPG